MVDSQRLHESDGDVEFIGRQTKVLMIISANDHNIFKQKYEIDTYIHCGCYRLSKQKYCRGAPTSGSEGLSLTLSVPFMIRFVVI